MKFIRDLFNRQGSTFVKLSDLAAIITPVQVNAWVDHSPKTVAHGFSELTEWTRIGFDAESNKGTHYNALNTALRSLTTQLESATAVNSKDGQPGVYLRTDDLRVLRATYWQIQEGAYGLRLIAEHMKPAPEFREVTDRHGNRKTVMDFTGVIPIYNRPNADHELAAAQIEDCLKRLDAHFGTTRVRPANDAMVHRYAEVQKLFR